MNEFKCSNLEIKIRVFPKGSYFWHFCEKFEIKASSDICKTCGWKKLIK